jgi:hypothetical protein
MPEYTQIETYRTCTRQTAPLVTAQYVTLLKHLHCTDSHLLETLLNVTWPSKEDEVWNFTSFSPFSLTAETMEEIACAGVAMMQDATALLAQHDKAWIAYDLYFEARTLRNRSTSRYLPKQGGTLWSLLRRFASFGELGAYLTDEGQDGDTYQALTEGGGHLWSFDLALIPLALAHHFQPVPPLYERVVVQEGIACARRDRWVAFPWTEGEVLS